MFKNYGMSISFLLVVFCCKTVADEYSCKEVEKVRNTIAEQFVDISSSDVAKKAHKKKTILAQFNYYLTEDEFMQKIKQIDQEGTSATALSVISMKHDVQQELHEKSDQLFSSLQKHDKGELISQEMLVLGIAGLLAGIGTKNKGLAAGGGVAIIAGSSGWYYSSSKKDAIRVHIVTVNKMEEKWDHTFENCVIIPGPGKRN